jgi:hypothetical protein
LAISSAACAAKAFEIGAAIACSSVSVVVCRYRSGFEFEVHARHTGR